MEYWLSVVDELADQTGVDFCHAQRMTAASILESAASVHGEYSAHSEPPPSPSKAEPRQERHQSWWEDVSVLSGSDWVLAKQIHNLIASRHG